MTIAQRLANVRGASNVYISVSLTFVNIYQTGQLICIRRSSDPSTFTELVVLDLANVSSVATRRSVISAVVIDRNRLISPRVKPPDNSLLQQLLLFT